LAKVLCDVIRDPLGTNKNENLGVLGADDVKVFDQLRALLKVAADFNNLGNIMIRRKLH
jgi:hypothetical protein